MKSGLVQFRSCCLFRTCILEETKWRMLEVAVSHHTKEFSFFQSVKNSFQQQTAVKNGQTLNAWIGHHSSKVVHHILRNVQWFQVRINRVDRMTVLRVFCSMESTHTPQFALPSVWLCSHNSEAEAVGTLERGVVENMGKMKNLDIMQRFQCFVPIPGEMIQIFFSNLLGMNHPKWTSTFLFSGNSGQRGDGPLTVMFSGCAADSGKALCRQRSSLSSWVLLRTPSTSGGASDRYL